MDGALRRSVLAPGAGAKARQIQPLEPVAVIAFTLHPEGRMVLCTRLSPRNRLMTGDFYT